MLGLVLEGGANRTYYTVGVLDAFIENGIKADFIVGVSAGIANGVSFVSGQFGRNLKLGMDYITDKRYMGVKYFFLKNNRSYYNIDFIFKEIPSVHVPFDYEAFASYDGDVYAVVTNVSNGTSEYLKVDDYAVSWKTILASCALPLMFKPVEIDGKLYMDGGCSDPLPVKFAYDNGCDKVITILTRERAYSKQSGAESRVSSFLFSKNREFAEVLKNRNTIYNNSKKYIFDKEKEGNAFVLSPRDTKGWKRTERNPKMLKLMYDEGYSDAIQRMDELKNFINS